PLRGLRGGSAAATLALAVGAGLLGLGAPPPLAAQEPAELQPPAPPSPSLLDELRQRLTAPPDCAPHCASWSRLHVEVGSGDRLLLRAVAEAQVDSALPLPVPRLGAGQDRVWQPAQVLVDGQEA